MLDPGDGLTLPEYNRVVNERDAIDDPDHLLWNVLGLNVVERDFLALVQEDPRSIDNAIALPGLPGFPFPLFKQLKAA